MVVAYHLVWTAYGTWLPNDPRGSGSRDVYTPVLAELGPSHYGRKSIQPRRTVVREFYVEAKPRLQFPIVRFDARHRNEVGAAFADVIASRRYTCYACAIMPDHVHMVTRKHRDRAEAMIEHLQSASRLRLSLPDDHPTWTKNGWKVFLRTPVEVRSRVRYVEGNPIKEGLPSQQWPFVTAYDNWPFHKQLSRKR